jgi:hypothetical protein
VESGVLALIAFPWAVYLGETAGRPGWSRGSITIDVTGAMAGAWVDADNQRRTVAPGSVAAIEGTGAVTGTYYLSEGGTATSTASPEGGKGVIAGAFTLTGARARQGTLTLVRRPPAATTPALIVTRTGTAAGVITSDPVGIVCGATCAATFPGGAAVTLQATPDPGSIFVGWSGDCVDLGPCTVTTSRAHHVMATFAPQPEIILDNRDPDVSRTGKWCVATATGSHGADSEYSCGPGSHAFRWTPTIPIAGNYQVYIRWPAHPDRATAVPVTVGHAGGTDTRLFNQQTDGSHWVLHGTYPFVPGASAYVEVTDANGQAAADAIRLVPAP